MRKNGMKRGLAVLLAVMFVVTSFTACGGDGSNGGGQGNEAKNVVVKFGTVCAESHPAWGEMQKFKAAVEERSGGNITVELYPNAQMGGEREMIEGVLQGTLEMFYGGSQILSSFTKAVDFQGLPFFFSGGKPAARDFFAVYGDEIGQRISDEINCTVVWTDNSAYGPATTNKKIEKPSDLKGVKIRTQEAEIMLKTYDNALGASPTPIAYNEVYTALQQGTINGANTNTILLETANWYEVCKYYTDLRIFVDMGITLFNNDFLASLDEEQRTILLEETDNFADSYWPVFEAEEALVKERMEAKGITWTVLDAEQTQTFVDAVQPVYNWYKETYGADVPNLDKYIEAAKEINKKYVK